MIKYAKLCRNYFRFGIIAAALSHVSLSHAGYAQLAPPPGWSPGGGLSSGAGGMFNFGNAANTASLVNGTVRTNAALNVGGRAVSIPATMRFAANAPKVAAGLIFAHPGLRTAAAIAAWLGVGKLIWDEAEGIWRETSDPVRGDGKLWWTSWNPALQPSPEAACLSSTGPGTDWSYQFIGILNGPSGPRDCNYRAQMKSNPNIWNNTTAALYSKDVETPEECPAGWTKTPAGCVSPAVDQPRFEEILAKPGNILPERVPLDLPHPLPINLPEISPLFIPTGNPVPNPNYNPSAPPGVDNQPWNQPGVRVTPAPVPGSPWQIDIQPINRPTDNPNPDPTPKPDPDPGKGDKPSDDKPGLCDMYPDILACAKPDLDTPDGEIPKAERSVELSDSDLFGGGSCPANVYATVGHKYLQVWNWDQSCYYIVKYLKPVILVLGAFTALMIVSGGAKE